MNWIADFGLRIAEWKKIAKAKRGMRIAKSRTGETVAIFVACLFVLSGAVNGLAAEPLPLLLPPHGELPPTFWEQYGTLAIISGVAGAAAIALLVIWLRRTRPVQLTPPEVVARRALEALRGVPEDGALLMKVSGIFRRYVIFAWRLSPGEMTSAELRRALAEHPGHFGRELAAEVEDFFRRCDERKFARIPPAGQLVAVEAALNLLGRIETVRTKPAEMVSKPPVIGETYASK